MTVPVFHVLAIYQETFRAEKLAIEIRTAEPLSPISVGDYLYEASFPEPLVAPHGHILQVVAKQHIISTHVLPPSTPASYSNFAHRRAAYDTLRSIHRHPA